MMGLSALILSQAVLAETRLRSSDLNWSEKLEGRYAKNCSTHNAHKLSYVISEKSMVRLINANEKHADFVRVNAEIKNHQVYQAIGSRNYGSFNVDFYQDGQTYLARVNYMGVDKNEPQSSAFLKQCVNPDMMNA